MTEEHRQFLIQSERDNMAIYLKITQACGCCLHRLNKGSEPCVSCEPMHSKWAWGGWKGRIGSTEMHAPRDYEEMNITK